MRVVKTFSTAALVAVGLLAACSRDEQKPGAAAQPASVPVVNTKPEMVPVGQRRVVELEGGIRVEVLAEGQGDVVAPGDHVALSMTLSYVPVPATAATEPAPAGEKSAKGEESKDASAEKAKPAEPPTAVEGVVVLEEVAAADAKVEPTTGEVPAPAEQPAGTEPGAQTAAATGTEPVVAPGAETVAPVDGEPAAATDGAASAATALAPSMEPGLAAPLEPVVLMSTKSTGMPLRVVVGTSGALLPGLSRALIGLRQGSIVEITLPPESAYGAGGLPSAGVPPGTPLFATVEIREVKR